ncbi:phosphoribulokinase, chloroplastic, partial [Tanacetum coccineum]
LAEVESRASVLPFEVLLDETEASPIDDWCSKKKEMKERSGVITCSGDTIVIGLAVDYSCGKSTFIRRLTSVFGGAALPRNPDFNTLISDTTTFICLDDYHSLDRTGRKQKGVTALDPRANDFDFMYEQVKSLKDGLAVEKPIYNHVSGLLDPPEHIKPLYPASKAKATKPKKPKSAAEPSSSSDTPAANNRHLTRAEVQRQKLKKMMDELNERDDGRSAPIVKLGDASDDG